MLRKILQPGSILIKEGDASDQMYLLEQGRLRVFTNNNEQEILLGYIEANELVGEISFLDQNPRSANVIAEDECSLIEIPRDVFEKLLASQPSWISGLIRTLASRLRDANKRIRV